MKELRRQIDKELGILEETPQHETVTKKPESTKAKVQSLQQPVQKPMT
jgi:hypothetical protein